MPYAPVTFAALLCALFAVALAVATSIAGGMGINAICVAALITGFIAAAAKDWLDW